MDIRKNAINLPRFNKHTEQRNMGHRISKIALTLAISTLYTISAHSQLWSTDFEGTNTNVTLNTTDLTSVGLTGDNLWIINANYAGGTVGPLTIPPTPAQPTGISNNNQNYLHITSQLGLIQVPPITNAHFNPAAPSGESYFTEIATGLSTFGQTGISLRFWLLNGSPASQVQVYVKDGATGTWALLNNANFSPGLGNISTSWTQTTYTGSQLNNLNDIFLGFRYLASPTGNMPSLAIDDIEIIAPTAVVANIIQPNPLPTTLCSGDTITFAAQTNASITSYQWNFNGGSAGLQTLMGTTASFTAANVINPTLFNFQLIVSDGVTQDIQTFQVTIFPCNAPNISISGSPTAVCAGSQVTYTNNTVPGSTPITGVLWTFPGGTPGTSIANNPIVTYTAPGTYSVFFEVTDSSGTYRDTLTNYINVLNCPPPIANFNASKTLLCPGDCISFTDQSTNMGAAGASWLWQFPGSDSVTTTTRNPQNICYQTPGVYDVYLTATNVNGSDTRYRAGFIRVDSCLSPLAQFTVERRNICSGTCIQFTNTSLRADSVNWTFYGADAPYFNTTTRSPIVCYSDTGKFDVQLVAANRHGLNVELMVEYIDVRESPQVQAPEDRTILIGNSTQLEAFGSATNFSWEPLTDIEGADTRTPTVSPKVSTIYYVTNTNSNGCTKRDSVRVLVRREFYAGVPDIFSPNNDGVNDVLYVRGNGITNVEFQVFNRAGERVFESKDLNFGWDGNYRGKPVNPGVFVYFARIAYINGYEEIIQGDVTLIR